MQKGQGGAREGGEGGCLGSLRNSCLATGKAFNLASLLHAQKADQSQRVGLNISCAPSVHDKPFVSRWVELFATTVRLVALSLNS